MGLEPAAA